MDKRIIYILLVELALMIFEVIRKVLNRKGQDPKPTIDKVNHVLRNVKIRKPSLAISGSI